MGRGAAREQSPSKKASTAVLQEAAMLIADVLRTKGHNVVRIHPTDIVENRSTESLFNILEGCHATNSNLYRIDI